MPGEGWEGIGNEQRQAPGGCVNAVRVIQHCSLPAHRSACTTAEAAPDSATQQGLCPCISEHMHERTHLRLLANSPGHLVRRRSRQQAVARRLQWLALERPCNPPCAPSAWGEAGEGGQGIGHAQRQAPGRNPTAGLCGGVRAPENLRCSGPGGKLERQLLGARRRGKEPDAEETCRSASGPRLPICKHHEPTKEHLAPEGASCELSVSVNGAV